MPTNWKRDSKQALLRLKDPAKRFWDAFKTLNPFKALLPLTWFLMCVAYALVCIGFFSLRKFISWVWHKATTP